MEASSNRRLLALRAIIRRLPGLDRSLGSGVTGGNSQFLSYCFKLFTLAILCVAGFAWLLRWFAHTDVYHGHFFDHGAIVIQYHVCRLAMIAIMAWLVYFPGFAMTLLIGGRSFIVNQLVFERYLLGFLTGAGLWHLALFAVGLAGGYQRSLAIVATMSLMIASIPHLLYCLEEGASNLWRARYLLRGEGKWTALLALTFAVAALVFLAVKGLYPAGGHDYYTHYFYYYLSVIKHHSTLPNEFWYHFYYSKGAGLYFVGMLLTDPLAPQLVTSSFIGCGALTVFAVLRKGVPGTLTPWIGAILYVTFFIFTPGPEANRREGGWGDLEKLHELTAVMLLGIIWISIQFNSSSGRDRWIWLTALAITASACVLITFATGPIIGAYLLAQCVWSAIRKRWDQSLFALVGIAASCLTMLLIMAINYALTGIVLDQFLVQTWKIVDLEKVNRWGVLNEVLWTERSHIGQTTIRVPLTSKIVQLIFDYMRLGIWWPLAVLGIGAMAWAGVRWLRGTLTTPPNYALVLQALFIFAGIFCLVAVCSTAARQQAISFYRFSSFMYAPTLCLCLLLCGMLPNWGKLRLLMTAAVLLGGVCGYEILTKGQFDRQIGPISVTLEIGGKQGQEESRSADEIQTWIRHRDDLRKVLANAKRFLKGQYSLRDAYQNQQGWPGRMPWGGIYPPMESVREIVGDNVPIYSFHIHSYSMLPNTDLRSFMSSATPLDIALTKTREETRRAFEKDGISYFFISTELSLTTPLPFSPFFSPQTIGDHLGVKWTDGTSYLLTWAGPDTQPLDRNFLERYAKQVKECSFLDFFPVDDWKAIFADFERNGLKPRRLPWE